MTEFVQFLVHFGFPGNTALIVIISVVIFAVMSIITAYLVISYKFPLAKVYVPYTCSKTNNNVPLHIHCHFLQT